MALWQFLLGMVMMLFMATCALAALRDLTQKRTLRQHLVSCALYLFFLLTAAHYAATLLSKGITP